MGGYGYFTKHKSSLAAGIFCSTISHDRLCAFEVPVCLVSGAAMLFPNRHWQEERQSNAIQQRGVALLHTGSDLSIVS